MRGFSFGGITKNIRFSIVKLLSPKLSAYISPTRPMMRFVETLGTTDLIGVEIGVAEGINAENILKSLPMKRLFLVDPYIPYVNPKNNQNPELLFPKALKRLNKYGEKAVFVRAKSAEAAKVIPDNLDFVYIDGNHAYDFVKKDIELYYPKIKVSGVIGGHDFATSHIGVCKAVIEFAEKHALEIHGAIRDWWFVK